jgi:hypothetical protein
MEERELIYWKQKLKHDERELDKMNDKLLESLSHLHFHEFKHSKRQLARVAQADTVTVTAYQNQKVYEERKLSDVEFSQSDIKCDSDVYSNNRNHKRKFNSSSTQRLSEVRKYGCGKSSGSDERRS